LKKPFAKWVASLNHLENSNKIMKKIFIISLVLFSSRSSFAQANNSKVEQYCQIIATPRLLSNRVTIDIDFGEEKSIWRDNRLKTYDGRLRKFNTVIDALNYMGKDGWIFINAYPVSIGGTVIYHFAFKKEFLLSDFQQEDVSRANHN
jgi:hypothetical protein